MGREIRRVPVGWEHPTNPYCMHLGQSCSKKPPFKCFRPLHNDSYTVRANRWLQDLKEFKPNEHAQYFWDWDGMPPDKESYRPEWKEEECNGWVVYETVSEGTPVTPVFFTAEDLIEYLVTYGDFWDQGKGSGGWTRSNAEEFVRNSGWVPSMIAVVGQGMFQSKDCPDIMRKKG